MLLSILARLWALPAVALQRVAAATVIAIEVFAEAQELARKARLRRPFAD